MSAERLPFEDGHYVFRFTVRTPSWLVSYQFQNGKCATINWFEASVDPQKNAAHHIAKRHGKNLMPPIHQMEYDPKQKPASTICPGRFCFFFGGYPIEVLQYPELWKLPEKCNCSFGVCTRLDPVKGDHDWYEPCEPELEEAGLPWFYFTPSPLKLVKDMREEYISASEALWGENHWEEK